MRVTPISKTVDRGVCRELAFAPLGEVLLVYKDLSGAMEMCFWYRKSFKFDSKQCTGVRLGVASLPNPRLQEVQGTKRSLTSVKRLLSLIRKLRCDFER